MKAYLNYLYGVLMGTALKDVSDTQRINSQRKLRGPVSEDQKTPRDSQNPSTVPLDFPFLFGFAFDD